MGICRGSCRGMAWNGMEWSGAVAWQGQIPGQVSGRGRCMLALQGTACHERLLSSGLAVPGNLYRQAWLAPGMQCYSEFPDNQYSPSIRTLT